MNEDSYTSMWNADMDQGPTISYVNMDPTWQFLGNIISSQPIEFKDYCFTELIMTDRYRIRLTVRLRPEDMNKYDPWSKEWQHHLTPTIVGFEFMSREADDADKYGAKLSDQLRKMALEAKPDQDESPQAMASMLRCPEKFKDVQMNRRIVRGRRGLLESGFSNPFEQQ